MFQYNQVTIILEGNVRFYISNRTNHIKENYVFLKENIEQGGVEVQICPTEMMWSDTLNNQKQGKAFFLDWSHLMNVPADYDDEQEGQITHPNLTYHKKVVLENYNDQK